jgi:thiamine biosynthesis protein ThiS
MAIKLTVNGQPREAADGATGADLLAALGIAPGAVVAEVNGDVVKRDQFLARILADGDMLELVTLVGGG